MTDPFGNTWSLATHKEDVSPEEMQKRMAELPPPDAPERRMEGELGAAALYLTEEIAIHGTDHPELLGDAISHGCIRMSNDDVLRLYEELEVGAPVIIH